MANVCVFASSTKKIDEEFYRTAKDLGRLIGEREHTLIYGGSHRGLMGTTAASVLEHNGSIVEVIPKIFEDSALGKGEVIITDDLWDRKRIMWDRSHGFISLPGGFGSLDEITDILVTNQVAEVKPLAIVNTHGFYDDLSRQFERVYAENFASVDVKELYLFTQHPEEALDFVESFTAPKIKSKIEHADAE